MQSSKNYLKRYLIVRIDQVINHCSQRMIDWEKTEDMITHEVITYGTPEISYFTDYRLKRKNISSSNE